MKFCITLLDMEGHIKKNFYWATFHISVQLQVSKYAEEVPVINLYYAQLKNAFI